MTKKKTYKELYDTALNWIIYSWLIALIILAGVCILWGILEDKVENQLTECQDKVEVWELTVECDYDWDEFEKISYTLYLNNHSKYIELLEEVDDEWCEVIK